MKYKKIIFLDVDGCINTFKYTEKDWYGKMWDYELIDLLKYIIDNTNADIVISSQRRTLGLEYLKELWDYRGYPGNVVDVTPYSEISRGDDINMWLEKNSVDVYCIIDDLDDDFYPEQHFYLAKCQTKIGLTKVIADKAISILNK
jgi:hypothetical protein